MSKKNRSPWSKPAPAASEPRVSSSGPAQSSDTPPPDYSPISPAELAANRANAQLSTGPRTPAGKTKSSKNAVRTALTGQTVLLPTDDVEEYTAFVAGFQRDLAPVGTAECELVQSIANAHWRLRRIQALEFALYTHGHSQFEEAFNDHPEEDRYNLILLQTHMTYEKQFRNFQIQEARLDRKRGKDMAELLRLQADRKPNQQETIVEDHDLTDPELEAALARRDAFMANFKAEWAAKKRQENRGMADLNGFVFSNAPAQLFETDVIGSENSVDELEAA